MVAIVILLVGCSTSAKRLAAVSPGMAKAQVVDILGNPESVSGQKSEEVFIYTLSNSWNGPVWSDKHHVYFIDGRVVHYGK